ncbi:MAG TPA: single-stranded DNA-binding protein [Gemmataceae bacterium]|nr:single-stranded DNA-binding protein [Gemmataceae bacterium]
MANLNKVMLIGRLTRDPEVRTFSNGGKVAKIGFAVNNRKKNQQTGQWEDDPVFIDVDAFNRETGRKLADLVEQYLRKGHQAYIEGNLVLDQWTDKDGQKRSKLKVVLQDVQFLEPKADGASSDRGEMGARTPRANSSPPRRAEPNYSSGGGHGGYDEPEPDSGRGNQEDDIPF